MKKIIVCLIGCWVLMTNTVQGQIPVCPYYLNQDIQEDVSQNLKDRIDHILSYYGYGTISGPERLVMTVSMTVVENNVAPANPPRVSKKIEMVLKLGDVVDNVVFSAASVPLSGIGLNDNKAFMAALQKIKPENEVLKKLFANVDKNMIEFYKDQSVFISKARSLALGGDFDAAIAYLVSIPPIDEACYNACQNMAINYYTEIVNEASHKAYVDALSAWTANKTSSGAERALQYLKLVNSASADYENALHLWDVISEKLDRDEVEKKEMARRVYEDKVQFKNSIVDACKAIGVAFGQGQPDSVTKIIRRW